MTCLTASSSPPPPDTVGAGMARSTQVAMKTRSKARDKRPREDHSDTDEPEPGPAPKKMTTLSNGPSASSKSRHPTAVDDIDSDAGLILPLKAESSPPPTTRLTQFKELGQARREISLLQKSLQEERERSRHREMQMKQSMFFDILRQQDKNKELEGALMRERRQMSKMKHVHAQVMNDLQNEVQLERVKQAKLVSDASEYQRESEHHQELCRILGEDLEELKRLHNDERAAQRNHRLGLPPAYGSLDDEEQPPWDQHWDFGYLDISTVQELAREGFMRDVAKARSATRARRSGLRNDSGGFQNAPELFVALFHACAEQCWRGVKHWLGGAELLRDTAQEYVDYRHTSKGARPWHHRRSQVSLISQRFADLVLELFVRLISILELEPCSIILTPRQRIKVGLSARIVDDTLLKCLRKTFDFEDRLLTLQLYLTQVNMIHNRLKDVWPRFDLDTLLGSSSTWLSENVEKERQLAAQTPER